MRGAVPPIKADFEQFIPYWTTEGGWHTELQLRNNLALEPLSVTPVVHTSSGATIDLPSLTISPGDIGLVQVDEGLSRAGFTPASQADSYGSVSLRYHSISLRSLYASAMVHDSGHPIMFHLDAETATSAPLKSSRQGVWWLPNAAYRRSADHN